MKTVKYCEKSTVSEAWLLVKAQPLELDLSETDIFLNATVNEFKKNCELLKPSKGIIIRGYPEKGTISPQWDREFYWSNNDSTKHLVRLGPGYFSLHFLTDPDKYRYEKYGKTLEPELKQWLNSFKQSGNYGSKWKIGAIGFGYTNKYEFSSTNFDMLKNFNLGVYMSPELTQNGVNVLSTDFSYSDKKQDALVSVSFRANAPQNKQDKKLIVHTTVFSERSFDSDLSFKEESKLVKEIFKIKEVSKNTFFNKLVTEDTRVNIMKAVYD